MSVASSEDKSGILYEGVNMAPLFGVTWCVCSRKLLHNNKIYLRKKHAFQTAWRFSLKGEEVRSCRCPIAKIISIEHEQAQGNLQSVDVLLESVLHFGSYSLLLMCHPGQRCRIISHLEAQTGQNEHGRACRFVSFWVKGGESYLRKVDGIMYFPAFSYCLLCCNFQFIVRMYWNAKKNLSVFHKIYPKAILKQDSMFIPTPCLVFLKKTSN